MQKAIGFIACISVMAASLYLFSGSDPSRILSAQTESANADGYGSVARRFMNDAREHAKQGNLAHARRLAGTAAELNVTWQAGEQTPDQFLAELDGGSDQPLNPFSLTEAIEWPEESGEAGTDTSNPFFKEGAFQANTPEQPPLPRNASLDMINKHKAGKLMREARTALNGGDFAMARTRAMQARSLKVTWGLWDEKPEHLLAEADRLDGTSTFMADGTQPALSAPHDASKAYQQAKALVHQARTAMANGKLQMAAELADRAEALQASYELFEDSPALVKQDLAKRTAVGAAPAVAFADAAQQPPSQLEQQAQGLLGEARAALAGGDFAAARTKAQQAESLNVAYGLLDDRPELVLAEVDRALGGQSGRNPFETESFVNDDSATPNPFAQNGPVDVTPVPAAQPSGVVAIGNVIPNGAGIALTANAQQEYGNPTMPPNMDPMAEMDPLEATTNELDVRFTRLRTEVLNSIFRAEKLKEKNNEEALTVLERTMESVQQADLPEESTRVLAGHLERAQKNITSYMELRAPIIANERRNQSVREAIENEVETQIRIEQEFADLTTKFNDLMRQRRYAEAELVARKAKDLNPNLPQSVIMVEKAKLQRQISFIEEVKEKKADNSLKLLNGVDEAFAASVEDYSFPQSWTELSDRRKSKYGRASARTRTESELKIEKSLAEVVSLHFHSVPLTDVIRHVATTHGINIALDTRAIETEGLMADVAVSIDVDGITLRSALNLLLQQAGGLVYDIENEVLKITNRLEQETRFELEVYPVADLVIPLGLDMPTNPLDNSIVNATAGYGNGMYQVQDDLAVSIGGNGAPRNSGSGSNGSNRADFSGLIDLITTTVEPGSWDIDGGSGRLQGNENTLSLVIRQTPKVHDMIVDLLGQLRKLQDLQVTVEVRFISVTDRFFERIGVDFDFNVQDTLGDPAGTPAFGSRQLQFPGGGGAGGGGQGGGQGGDLAGGGQQGQQGQQTTGGGLFDPLQRVNSPRDDFSGQTVGLSSPDAFTEDYDIQFRQGSFELGVPDFGNFNPDAGIQVGMAILSDIEAFFFIQAAQADERANVLFAPKVTLFNGQQATIIDSASRPFVVGLIPVVGNGAVGFQPIITQIQDGIQLQVVAVISADRRFVRLSLGPQFNNVVDVFTFSFASGGAGGGAIGGGQGGQQGQGGGGFGGGGQGGGGGFGGGGGGFGGGGFGGGFGGIGGQGGGQGGGFGGGQGGGGQGGQQGQQGQQGGGGGGTLTVQQPVQEIISVITTVSVPDGGTVLLGGIKRLREGRNMAGVPILNKIPYISRLFKNSGVGRETESVMLMVTPRIIIHEEEEELILGTSGL